METADGIPRKGGSKSIYLEKNLVTDYQEAVELSLERIINSYGIAEYFEETNVAPTAPPQFQKGEIVSIYTAMRTGMFDTVNAKIMDSIYVKFRSEYTYMYILHTNAYSSQKEKK